MTDKFEIIPTEDAEPMSTAWKAEWYGPEEELDAESLREVCVHVIYKDTKEFYWYYPQVKAVLEAGSVKEFLEFQDITDASANDVEELKAFFFHFVRFITFDITLPETTPQTFEPEEFSESMGDEDKSAIMKEFEQSGMKERILATEIKRTLH